MALKDWSTTAADNASAPGINWAEGQPPSSVNNSARQMMADIKSGVSAVCADVDEMAALTKAKQTDGTIVQVLGRAAIGDGGGGFFYWDASSTATPDGGTIFASDEGGVGRWIRDAKEISVAHFGALGDGSDQSAALLAAFSWLSSGDRTLHVGAGVYVYSSDILINSADAISLIGENRDSVKFVASTGVGPRPFIFRNCNGVLTCGIHFYDDNVKDGEAAFNNVEYQNCSNVLFEKNRVEGANFYGLGVFQDTSGGPAAACNNVVVRFNEFKDVGTIGLEVFPKVLSYNFEAYGNTFIDCGLNPGGFIATPCAMKPGQAYVGAKIYDNVIRGGKGGIFLGNYETLECYNNEIIDNTGRPVSISVTTHTFPYTASNRYIHVHNNSVIFKDHAPTADEAININGTVTNNGPIIIDGNTIDGAYDGIYATGSVAFPNLQIINNKIGDLVTGRVIRIYNVSGSSPAAPLIKGNIFKNRNGSSAVYRVELVSAPGTIIQDNTFFNAGNNAIVITTSDGTVIESNIVYGYNGADAANVALINITDTSASKYFVLRNKLYAAAGNPIAFYNGNSANPTVIAQDNWSDTLLPFALSGTPNVSGGALEVGANAGGRGRTFYGTAAPSGGAYYAGDIVWNTSPTNGGNIGWVCTSGGTPGTWKTFGAISA